MTTFIRTERSATRALGFSVVLWVGLAGCGADDPLTGEYATSEIAVSLYGRSNGQIAQVFATPSHEHGPLELSDGDRLVAGALDEPLQDMTRVGSAYVVELETPSRDFTVSLLRDSDVGSDLRITLPEPFDLFIPVGPVSRSEPFMVTWSPTTNDSLRIEVSAGDCIRSFGRLLNDDSGRFTVQPADLFVEPGVDECNVVFGVTRSRSTPLDSSELAPSAPATSDQIRAAEIQTVP